MLFQNGTFKPERSGWPMSTVEALAGASLGFILVVLGILVVLWNVLTLHKRVAALSRVDAKLDALLKHSQVDYDPFDRVSKDVAQALKLGDTIMAIKHYRKETGAALKDAKEYIEEIQRRGGFS